MLHAVSGKLSLPAAALRFHEGELEDALPRVFRALVAMGARPDEAEDAVQEAAARALGAGTAIERIDGWLFIVALRVWRGRRVRERLLRPLEWFTGSTPGPDPMRVTLLGELARLPTRQRQVIVARYVLGAVSEGDRGRPRDRAGNSDRDAGARDAPAAIAIGG